jgi:uncharacterized protein (DUF433 family)
LAIENRVKKLNYLRASRSTGSSEMKNTREYKERIVIDPRIHFGKPCVAGTRIPVESVLELIQEGLPFAEIVEAYYPDLEIEDVKACARYATDLVRHEEIHIGAV